jgi:peptidoglycan/xylan/chitin deacetylase (PgdA/CDA1 family)
MLWSHIPVPLQRRLAKWFGRRPCQIQLESPVISFTFDDFPRSALTNGGAILRERGFSGTYYASFGLMGMETATGKIFGREDLEQLIQHGHELACHTFDHCDSWETDPKEFEDSIERNRQAAARDLPGLMLRSFSYPISWPRPETKRRVASHFQCARGGGQTFNTAIVDLNYLKAFFIEQSRDNFDAIKCMIDANARVNGWLIFATHDVSHAPTRFGCTPQFLNAVVEHSARSGAAILPVSEALKLIREKLFTEGNKGNKDC